MKITAVHLYTMKIPLLTPFKTALRTVENMENVVVTLETDEGALGFGEAPPTAVITGDTIPSIAGAIRDFLAPKILGREVTNADEMHDAIEGAMVHNTSAKAAVEMAVYDLIGKKWGIPLYKLLGGARESLETDITISVNDVDTMVADSLAACSRGFRILKVKVGTDVELDLARLSAIRSAVPADTVLRVDANQGWTPRQAVRIIGRLEDAGLKGLAYAERGFRNVTNSVRPVNNADDLAGLKLRVMENEVYTATFKALKVNAVPMAWAEALTAMQQGTIEGEENPINVIYSYSLWDYGQKYVTLDRHSYSTAIITMSLDVFNSLDEATQAIFLQSAQEAAEYERAWVAEQEADQLATIKSHGVEVVENPDVDSLRAAVQSVDDAYPQYADYIARIQAMLAE